MEDNHAPHGTCKYKWNLDYARSKPDSGIYSVVHRHNNGERWTVHTQPYGRGMYIQVLADPPIPNEGLDATIEIEGLVTTRPIGDVAHEVAESLITEILKKRTTHPVAG